MFKKKNAGFTLIELMMVVAIIGTLSAISIPYFGLVQNKAKRAELYNALAGIYTVQVAYFSLTNEWKDPECANNTFCICSTAGGIPNWDRNFKVEGFTMSSSSSTFGYCQEVLVGGQLEMHGGGNLDKDPTLDHAFVTSGNRSAIFNCDDLTNTGPGC